MRQLVLDRDGAVCALCGDYGDVVDHIVPLAHGGTDHMSNLRVLCTGCNSRLGGLISGSGRPPRRPSVVADCPF